MGRRSGASARRRELYAEMERIGRDSSALGLVIHQAIAESFGLGPTDLKCLDLARHEEDLTAGRLAELTGLSTSAVTAAIDRLERGRFVRRERDRADRRKVYVVPTHDRDAELAEAYGPIGKGFMTVLEEYDDDQLELIADYARRLDAATRELARRLTARPTAAPPVPPAPRPKLTT